MDTPAQLFLPPEWASGVCFIHDGINNEMALSVLVAVRRPPPSPVSSPLLFALSPSRFHFPLFIMDHPQNIQELS